MNTAKRAYPKRVSLAVGVNDLKTLHPELMSQWNPKNTLSPELLHPGSNTYVYWFCLRERHELRRMVKEFVKDNSKCNICAGQKILPGYNGLAQTHPELASEWDSAKNTKEASEVSSGSKRRFFWICSKGHSYEASPHNRKHGRGCPICFGRTALTGYNDLETSHPEVAVEWSKNNPFSPREITAGSGKKVLWTCEQCSHEWAARPCHRTKGHGCPECAAKSRLEEKVAHYLQQQNILYNRRWRGLKDSTGRRRELDFFLKKEKIAFEVQDFSTHSRTSDSEKTTWPERFGQVKKGPTYHRMKKELAEAKGITLIELWENEILNNSFKIRIQEEIKHVASSR